MTEEREERDLVAKEERPSEQRAEGHLLAQGVVPQEEAVVQALLQEPEVLVH
mgnify:CR=1 FL=1